MSAADAAATNPSSGAAAPDAVRLFLADVDGTLVTRDKALTDRAKMAVRELRDRGVAFTVTSGRPPRGLKRIVDALAITAPIAAFDGALYMQPDGTITEQRTLPGGIAARVVEILRAAGVGVWLYRGEDWFVLGRDRHGPHVDREEFTVQFPPMLVDSFDGLLNGDTAKITGVSDDPGTLHRCEQAVLAAFGKRDGTEEEQRSGTHQGKDAGRPALVSATLSQPYYLDVTHPDANKGAVVQRLARVLGLSAAAIATIGDQPNDILMFREGGISVAMGNAPDDVKRAARFVTSSNEEEGFANAVERFILPYAAPR